VLSIKANLTLYVTSRLGRLCILPSGIVNLTKVDITFDIPVLPIPELRWFGI
jgi:hypothetical protein